MEGFALDCDDDDSSSVGDEDDTSVGDMQVVGAAFRASSTLSFTTSNRITSPSRSHGVGGGDDDIMVLGGGF